ncbi:MAG: STAS/SEC14 domain-containing protein [Phycisphaerales bacterium JB063]
MFTITPNGPNRLDLTLSGKLDKEQMAAALDDMLTKAEGIKHGKMLYRIVDFHLPSLGAIGVEMIRLPKMLKLIGRFDKCAVLAEKDWLKKVSEIEGALIPGLEIKAFDLVQEDAAEAWLAD